MNFCVEEIKVENNALSMKEVVYRHLDDSQDLLEQIQMLQKQNEEQQLRIAELSDEIAALRQVFLGSHV